MRNVYKVLAYLVAILVAVQSAMAVWGDSGLNKWIAEGGVLDKSVSESGEAPFPEVLGLVVHGLNGKIVIPIVALLLLMSSFWAKVDGAVRAAALVLLLVVLQIGFGTFSGSLPLVGAVHGVNALLLFVVALHAARRPAAAVAAPEPHPVARG
ncbi:hypothetical protein [Nonomuraea rubra]|uniref:Uncharacterized protein n=1 Tax=Nonomuraea rubra TaxID=46180 RepID=A0A7X0NWD8_9ACTN|nr:hypothetical protein [Nonomuraea rubra]MBB6550902.1 hypothetical protein [Nonomuraea rubra]